MTQPSPHRTDPVYLEWHRETKQFFLGVYEKLVGEQILWASETLKHIALISLAGLAGVFALVGGGQIKPAKVYAAALAFAVSSALCVLAMYIGALIRRRNLKYFRDLIARLTRHDVLTSEDFKRPPH